jgi:hypothetical protein
MRAREFTQEGLRDIVNWGRNVINRSDRDAPIVMMTNPRNQGAVTNTGRGMRIQDFPLRMVPVEQLRPWEPMTKMRDLPSQRTVASLRQALQQGDKIPPLLVTPVRGGYRIIDGHHRYAALLQTGVRQAPVRVVDPRLIRYSDEVMEALKITLRRYGDLGARAMAESPGFDREPLYHATLKAFEPSIRKHGLLPGGNLRMFDWSDHRYVYLSNYPDIASSFIDPSVIEPNAEREQQILELMKQGGVIFKIDQNKLDRRLLSADSHWLRNDDTGEETYIYSGAIPPSAIMGREYFSIDGSAGGVAESLDQPYRIKWTRSMHGDYDALAALDDGTYLSIMFNKESKNNWMVEFYRNNRQEVTGEGDSQRVFATVLTAIAQFIEKKKPVSLFFSAVKEDDPKGSREKLYDRLVQRYAGSLGYMIHQGRTPMGSMTYKFTRKQQGVAENFADGKVKGKSRPGRVKRSGASCSGSVTDLRARAQKYGGERGRMYHWCANMKSGRKKNR